MLIGSQGDRPHALEQFSKTGVAGEVGAQHQDVDEEPDQALELGPMAIGDERAHRDIVLPAVAVQQGLEGRQQGHEQGDAVPLAQGFEGLRQRRRQRQPVSGAPKGLYCRTRMVRGQLQHGHPGELLLPVGQRRV